ncbi:hypothetical protein AYX13_03625 [Cryptococcus neoformans]|nr:hypothetical protein AYX13_03625 [Cryptococcus neoformans var. grubii]
MAVPVDIPKSEASRAEGNTAFKKGKWVEAIGHYTNAVIYNPEDPVAYCNRAQAFLKLDKYHDAERDCTSALALPKGKNNIKALYRRGLARKGMEKVEGALSDMEEVLRLDKSNSAVKPELEELQEMKTKMDQEKKKPSRRPLTPPTLPKPLPKESSNPPKSKDVSDLTNLTQDLGLKSTYSQLPEEKKESSFAAMRKSRDGKKMSFAGESTPQQSARLQAKETAADAALSAIFPPLKPRVTPISESKKPAASTINGNSAPSTSNLPPLPTSLDTTSTSPGAGLSLLRYFTSSPTYNFSLLSLYPAENIPKILGTLLEPDTLGFLLLALDEGANKGTEKEKENVKKILEGLRQTKRWKMNVGMLSAHEKKAGEGAWKSCGGTGSWI